MHIARTLSWLHSAAHSHHAAHWNSDREMDHSSICLHHRNFITVIRVLEPDMTSRTHLGWKSALWALGSSVEFS